MLFRDIAYVDENFEVVEHGYVGVREDRIAYLGCKKPEEDFGQVYEGKGKLLIPSFVNAHSHMPMSILRGYAENLPLMDWLNGRIWPFEAQLSADDMYWGCMLGIAEALRFGIGSSSEMYLHEEPLGRAFTDSGAKGNFCVSVIWMDKGSWKENPLYREVLDAHENFHGSCNGRVRHEICVHAEYTTTEAIARGMAECAKEYGMAMQVHVSESKGEVDMCRLRHQGRSPIRYLADCGVFDVPTTAAHCVWPDDEDFAILREKGVTVASCPKSNAKLASGIAPISRYLKEGVNVAIGTDSVASNNNLNMLEEMRFFNLFQKVQNLNPVLITPKETLYAATRAGALAQQRLDCGLIKEGFKADLAVIEADAPWLRPRFDYLNNLIYSSSSNDILLTMVDGKVLYQDGEYPSMDIERIIYEVDAARSRILRGMAAANIPDLVIL